MAAIAAESIEAAMERLGNASFLCEWKYDGERCQAHLLPQAADARDAGDAGGSRVRLFSRSLDEVSARFPEIVEALPQALAGVANGAASPSGQGGVTSAILDAEICAVDEESGAVLPFQALASRPRKAPTVEQLEVGPPVCVFAFDLLELNGESLLRLPLATRRAKLREVLQPVPSRVALAEGAEVSSEAELRVELERAVDMQSEGLLIKSLGPREGGTAYEPGKRSLHWLKLKRDYIDGMGDSFDLVPIGAYRGRGKRAGGFGAYLLACYDPAAGVYQPVCKLGSGFSDEQLARLSEGAVASGSGMDVRVDIGESSLPAALEPHTWLEPTAVWEVTAAAVSVSPIYRAAYGLVDDDKGLALRFPRLVRERPDKEPAQATTAAQLAAVYESQPVL